MKADILAVAADWYLWRDELATVDAGAISDPVRLPRRARPPGRGPTGKDRPLQLPHHQGRQQPPTSTRGENLGYGFGLDTRGTQLLVAQTFPSSAVSAAGLSRGDELVAIATERGRARRRRGPGLGDPAAGAAPATDPTADPAALSTALGSGQVSTRAFRVKKLGAPPPWTSP